MKRLMLLFAALLCVVVLGCDEIYEDYYCLYFSAEIVDEEGVPIQGIYAYPEGGKFDGREGYSNHLGKIEAFGQIKPSRRFVVCIEDVDGEYNRGEYEGVAIDITNRVKAPSAPDDYGFTGSDIVDLGRVVLKRK
jgi:hypothetical protein